MRHQLPDPPLRLGGKELAERRDADEASRLAHRVEVGHGGDLGVDLPQVRHRFGDRPVGADPHEAVGHETARGTRLPGEKAARGRGVFRRHPAQDREAALFREEGEEAGRVVGLERVEGLGDPRRREARERHPEDAASEVGEDPAELVFVEMLQHGDPVFPRNCREEIGHVGRVEFAQSLSQRRRIVTDDLEDVWAEELADSHVGRV